MLFVGTIEPRKNVGGLLDAYARLLARRAERSTTRDRRARATLTPPDALAAMDRPPLAGHVEYRGYVSSGRPRSRCSRARRCSCCRPSTKGSAYPRSKRCLRACRSSSRTAARCPKSSATRDCSIDPDDPESLAAAMERLIGDADLRATCARRGLERARQFTWAQTARDVRRAYEDALLARRHRAPVSRRRTVERSQSKCASALTPASSAASQPASAVICRGCSAHGRRDAAASRHTFVLYAHEDITPPLPNAELRVIPGSPGTAWEQFALPKAAKQDRLDVFFAPGYTAPLLLNTPTVVLVHDISFAAHPEWFRWKEGLRRRWLTRWSCDHAKLVLTVSEAARREIISHFGLPENACAAFIPASCRCTCRPAASARARAIRSCLFVGSVFNRRHLPDLIRAFKPIAKSHPAARLEIVGDNRTYPHEDLPAIAAAAGIASQVSIRPYVPDAELADAVWARAGVRAAVGIRRVRPSAARSARPGVPPVLLDTDVAREVCGDAALYVAEGRHRRHDRGLEQPAVRRGQSGSACCDAAPGGARALLVDARRAPRPCRAGAAA